MHMRIFLALIFVAATAQGTVSFDQVRSIVDASCVTCHKGEQGGGGLRLDSAAGIARVVVPGKSADSPLIQRVTALDLRRRMPLGRPPLKPEEIAILREWIDAGAALPVWRSANHA